MIARAEELAKNYRLAAASKIAAEKTIKRLQNALKRANDKLKQFEAKHAGLNELKKELHAAREKVDATGRAQKR